MRKQSIWEEKWLYVTNLTIEQCACQIMAQPFSFDNRTDNPKFYKCEPMPDGRFFLTFCGARLGGYLRTEYMVSFHSTNGQTQICLDFYREILGLPPMTPLQFIDALMLEKLNAIRIN